MFKSTLLTDLIAVFAEQRKQVPFSVAIGNVELMRECFPKRFCTRIETEEEGETRMVNIERSSARRKKDVQMVQL